MDIDKEPDRQGNVHRHSRSGSRAVLANEVTYVDSVVAWDTRKTAHLAIFSL